MLKFIFFARMDINLLKFFAWNSNYYYRLMLFNAIFRMIL